mmetsp:Transcript_4954/g.3566  ORF Transcript_4954/g.3566 Transcript_4954/m.3566 type:complete len:100 (+) Transcript_4954:434-733(+)
MTRSDKKYADPTDVLKHIVDEFGKTIQVGEEKDIGEFNNTFLFRVSEGLNFQRIIEEEMKKKSSEENQMMVDEGEVPKLSDANSSFVQNEEGKDIQVDL